MNRRDHQLMDELIDSALAAPRNDGPSSRERLMAHRFAQRDAAQAVSQESIHQVMRAIYGAGYKP